MISLVRLIGKGRACWFSCVAVHTLLVSGTWFLSTLGFFICCRSSLLCRTPSRASSLLLAESLLLSQYEANALQPFVAILFCLEKRRDSIILSGGQSSLTYSRASGDGQRSRGRESCCHVMPRADHSRLDLRRCSYGENNDFLFTSDFGQDDSARQIQRTSSEFHLLHSSDSAAEVRRSPCARHAMHDVLKRIWPVRVLSVQLSAVSAGVKNAPLDDQRTERSALSKNLAHRVLCSARCASDGLEGMIRQHQASEDLFVFSPLATG